MHSRLGDMERVEFFKGIREVAEMTLEIPKNGTTTCRTVLSWVPVERESVMCGSDLTWTITRTIGVTLTKQRELEALITASIGFKFLADLEAHLRGKLSSELRLTNEITEEKKFTVKARECYELQIDIYQLQCTLSLSCEWNPLIGRKKYWQTEVEVWMNQFSRPCRALPRHAECGCPSTGETVGQLDIVGPRFQLTEPYLVHNKLLTAFTIGLGAEEGKVLIREGQGGDARWPPRDQPSRDWYADSVMIEEELLRPFIENDYFALANRAIPDYMRFLVGLDGDATVKVQIRGLAAAGA